MEAAVSDVALVALPPQEVRVVSAPMERRAALRRVAAWGLIGEIFRKGLILKINGSGAGQG